MYPGNMYNLSLSQYVSAVTLTVSSGSPPTTVSQQIDPGTLNIGPNSIQITHPDILSRYAIPGLQHSHTLSLAYSGLSNVSTPAAVSDFVATPLVLSNFGPSFTYDYVSGGVGTFTLPQPSSNGSSPGAFSYSVVGSAGVVSVSGNVVTMIAAGSATIRATQAAAGGYASAYVEASVTINPIAPTFSNNGVFTISSKNFGDAAFTPAYPTSNSSGAFTYTVVGSAGVVSISNNVVTILSAGTTTIRATQAAAGNYTSAYVEASFAVTLPLIMLDTNGVTIKYMDATIPSVPYFIQASPRGTSEWFAVVNDTSKSMITDYAKNLSSGSGRTYFTTSGNVVPFNNIVTTLMTNVSSVFANASTFNQNIASWDTSNVTNMYAVFILAAAFNSNISSWNTSNVTVMHAMFYGANAFNQNIGSWNTSNVMYMNSMFYAATAFNQPLNSWNTANVTEMNDMFFYASAFNQNISSWNVVKVTPKPPTNFSTDSALSYANNPFSLLALDANGVTVKYKGAALTTVPLFINANLRGTGSEWFAVVNDTSKSAITDYAKALLSGYGRLYFTTSGNVVPFNNIVTTLVTDMSYMFRDTEWFNENIGSWDISNVTSMSNMFYRAARFNQNIGFWNTSKVTDMSYALVLASAFNQPINSWNTSKVTNMSYMLGGMTVFNQPINSWDTANVIYMGAMFQNSSNFNQPIGNWKTSNVTNMSNMFDGATVFNQNISSWNVTKVTSHSNFSTSSALSYVNNPFSLLALDANGITVKYKGAALTTVPLFINANLRGTGSEWFAVVNDTSKSAITDYATSMAPGFNFTNSYGNVVPFNNIVTTLVTNMANLFQSASTFNQNIGSWDTSNVTTMNNMFFGASVFNQNISSWNVVKVTQKPPSSFSTSSALTVANSPVWT